MTVFKENDFKYSDGFWTTICCLFIMEENLINVKGKIWFRFLAHVLAALIAAVSALLIGDHIWLRIIPIALCFFFCGYIMVTNKVSGKAAKTLAIAACIMLLSGESESDGLEVTAMRFSYTVLGLGLGFLLTWLFIFRNSPPKHLLEEKNTLR
jgi:uncharacterized membrane protein YccC